MKLSLNEYQELSKRTLPNNGIKSDATNYALGLTGESGEVADELKKWIFHGHDLDIAEVKNELGDVLHYVAGLCSILNIELEDVATTNIAKLEDRYPNGFTEHDSINRK